MHELGKHSHSQIYMHDCSTVNMYIYIVLIVPSKGSKDSKNIKVIKEEVIIFHNSLKIWIEDLLGPSGGLLTARRSSQLPS